MEAEREKETMTVHRCPPIHPLPEEIKKVGGDSKTMLLKRLGRYLADFVL